MSELCILIGRRDDPASSTLTELASFEMPSPNLSTLQPATTLDDLETTTLGAPVRPGMAEARSRPRVPGSRQTWSLLASTCGVRIPDFWAPLLPIS